MSYNIGYQSGEIGGDCYMSRKRHFTDSRPIKFIPVYKSQSIELCECDGGSCYSDCGPSDCGGDCGSCDSGMGVTKVKSKQVLK